MKLIYQLRVVALFICCPLVLFAQQKIDAAQFFELGLLDRSEVENGKKEVVKFPLIEEYELRTQSDEFDFVRQQYTFRLSPSTRKKRDAQKALYEQLANVPDFDLQKSYCDNRIEVQADWLLLFLLQDQQKMLDGLNKILQDKQIVYEKMAGVDDFDFQKIVKLQSDKSELAIAINKLQLEQDFVLAKYNIGESNLDFTNFISIEKIASGLDLKGTEMINDTKSKYEKEILARRVGLRNCRN